MQLETTNLILRFPLLQDVDELINFDVRNAAHLAKWESKNFTQTEDSYKKRLKMWLKECEENKSARFLIFRKGNPNQLIGFCNFTQIFHGAFQACYLGYKIDKSMEGKGIMFEALQRAIEYVFDELHLHRIMANFMPENIRSAKLLHRLGFSIEGFAENYLLINNTWEDHVLTSLTYEKWNIRKNKEGVVAKKSGVV
jgi:[ribosomal protein S5]-alanine N-acetyltransferase